MKSKLMVFILFLTILSGCKKDPQREPSLSWDNTGADTAILTVRQAKAWMDSGESTQKLITAITEKKTPLSGLAIPWSKMKSVRVKSGNYLYAPLEGGPTFENAKQGYRKLLFTKDGSGTINVYILEVIPDAISFQREGNVKSKTFTGRVFIYDAGYSLLGGYVFNRGNRAGSIKPPDQAGTTRAAEANLKVASSAVPSVTCTWVNNNYINAAGEVVVYAEKVCTIDPVDLSEDLPSDLPPSAEEPPDYTEAGAGSPAPVIANLPGENNPKINPKDYMKCFGTLPDAGSKMTVTVYVQEPAPGLPFNVGTNSVGHTAIGLTKTYNGQSITQVVGFYPDATGKDRMNAPSKILDNSDLKYNVSITYPIIASEFNKIVNFVGNPPQTYDLADYNCTNFVYNACLAGGIKLPNPTGNIGFGQDGMTPAVLGNSLKKVAPDQNVNTSEGRIPESKGPCK